MCANNQLLVDDSLLIIFILQQKLYELFFNFRIPVLTINRLISEFGLRDNRRFVSICQL